MNFLGWVYTSGFEDTAHTFMARLRGNAFALVTQSSVASITCKVFDRASATPLTPIATPLVVVASSIYDILQTDGRWTADNAASPGADGAYGYNFLFQVPGTAFPEAGRVYEVEFTFTPTAGQTIFQGFRHTTVPISGS